MKIIMFICKLKVGIVGYFPAKGENIKEAEKHMLSIVKRTPNIISAKGLVSGDRMATNDNRIFAHIIKDKDHFICFHEKRNHSQSLMDGIKK